MATNGNYSTKELEKLRDNLDGLQKQRDKLTAELTRLDVEREIATSQAGRAILDGGNLEKLSDAMAAAERKQAVVTSALAEITGRIRNAEQELKTCQAEAAANQVNALLAECQRKVTDITGHYKAMAAGVDELQNLYQDALELNHVAEMQPLRLTGEAARIRGAVTVVSDFLFQYGRLIENDDYYGQK